MAFQKKLPKIKKSGTSPPKETTSKSDILFLVNDWKVVTNFNKKYVFPIALTALHPDTLIYFASLR